MSTAPTGTLETALAHAARLLGENPAMAEQQAREILRVVPHSGAAKLLLGQALAAGGQPDLAVRALGEAVRAMPDSAVAWRTLAEQLLLLGDEAGSDRAQAEAIRASVNDPRLRDAAVALARGDLPVAEKALKAHLKADPTDVAAIRMLAELAARIGRYPDSEALLRRAIELAPGFAPARFNLATVLYRGGRAEEALIELDRLMAEEPENPAYRNLAAVALTRTGDLDVALVHFEKALARQPGLTKVWLSYGHALKTLGRQADSVAAYRRAIALEPGFGEAWWSLANLKTVRFEPADLATMQQALADEQVQGEDRFHLHFALGKALEDAKQFEPAFRHYEQGNRLRLEAVPHDPAKLSERVERTIRLFTTEFLQSRVGQGCAAPDPIFILGMPRAGSTLVEQILASHPQVEGTQELPDIQMMATRLGGEADAYPELLASLPPDRLRALGEEFMERTRPQRRTDRPFFIDKMPNNWLHTGFIRLILPNAKIIDARRHPLACCFANYKQHFARGQSFAYSLEHMAGYYRDYARLMAHVDRVAPGAVHRVIYERMVDDTEAQVRALLAYLGLPFDPACLRFHETERAVRTASSEQVRRPIYRDGVEQWQNFEPWLGPLKQALQAEIAGWPA
ncbi:tetratricopeptide repeat protein [Sandaracinobacter neustonicus]|uniref:Tetratricopeptide repeat protein n=1 Tax=Sandaracinobacter neustonicus TaxID=1715348 RepID=A0A501XQE1_9SPHN|nr:tetratricopeptide repeat-containing sulfotransferase family protein [Sandaracinobacter neustonicus]TPE62685.1 tetratricopeptide repeat protein [Sandaracinobacter neustonicus]